MQFQPTLISLALAGSLWLAAILPAAAQTSGPALTPQDQVLLDMSQAFAQRNSARLNQLRPRAQGHVLEPWAAYWELQLRLAQASRAEIEAFLDRYAGTYQEDRLRNDWLLLLGQAADWETFKAQHPKFRMNDDRSVQCFAWLAAGQTSSEETAAQIQKNWLTLREADEGCATAAQALLKQGKLSPEVVWLRARLGMVWDNLAIGTQAVFLLRPDLLDEVRNIYARPQAFLQQKTKTLLRYPKPLLTLAWVRWATREPEAVAAEMGKAHWQKWLTLEERSWIWGVVGQDLAMRLSDKALLYFQQGSDKHMHEDQLAWKARAALRAGAWSQVEQTIAAMSPAQRQDSTWMYWRARALLKLAKNDAERALATSLLRSLAGNTGFYEQLAQEELGRAIVVPPAPPAPSPPEQAAAQANRGLQRALYAIKIGLRSEGVREWNYSTNLHTQGGMSDRELLAAAQLACQNEVWDRCINTSERTKSFADYGQRFPMPHKNLLMPQAKNSNLEPAYVYGLIRQESRFVGHAVSSAGAVGLMQVMPATALWTAKKIGLTAFKTSQLRDPAVNLNIGMSYLKLLQDDFSGVMPLATAGYNAGPKRAKEWRMQMTQAGKPAMEAAIWVENIPFSETRNYVKKVLSNATTYAALISGAPQSLKARLGSIGPAAGKALEQGEELP